MLNSLYTSYLLAERLAEVLPCFLWSPAAFCAGLSLALAIALHNIPEGVAVALPVYFATGSRWQGFNMAFLSGLAEPLAVVLVGLVFPGHVSKVYIDYMLAAVGGIMAFLSFHELLPLSIQHVGKGMAICSLFVGMAFMSVNLHLLNTYVLGGLH
jgi:ZIP family zinc transporter